MARRRRAGGRARAADVAARRDLPAERRSPRPSTALTAALVAAALGYPPTSGWFSALLIAAAAVYLTDRRRAVALGDVRARRRRTGVDGRRRRGGRAAQRVPAGRERLRHRRPAAARRPAARAAPPARAGAGPDRPPGPAARRGGGRGGRARARAHRPRRPRRRRQRPQRHRRPGGRGTDAGRTRIPDEAGRRSTRIAQMARDALAQTRAAVRGMRDAGDDASRTRRPGSATSTRCSTPSAPRASRSACCDVRPTTR